MMATIIILSFDDMRNLTNYKTGNLLEGTPSRRFRHEQVLAGTLWALALLAAVSGFALALAGCAAVRQQQSAGRPGADRSRAALAVAGSLALRAATSPRIQSGRSRRGRDGYWEGAPSAGGTPRYATDLLADPRIR